MTHLMTVVVAATGCGPSQTAKLLETRIYPADWLEHAAAGFQVYARRCSLTETCRAHEVPCRWTGLNPTYDPFEG